MINTREGVLYLAISLLVGSGALNAADSDHEHEHEHEQHEAHVHGVAQLLIGLENNNLEMEFLSPAMNLVGFEHQPQTETQTHAVEAAIDTLKQPDLLFKLPPEAGCKPVSIEVETPLSGHGRHAHDEELHSEFTGHYQYQCGDISSLERIEVELFKTVSRHRNHRSAEHFK